ncbi:MAG: L-seryl-tRNA(Sec) selenium transferase, partial [Anaerolineales bacterium]|nr:L-seryl-tRNA(Sec) selenium transferase [Anaerolineales bacterium]
MSDLRSLPSVDQLLISSQGVEWVAMYGRPLALDAIRRTLDQAREQYRQEGIIPDTDVLLAQIQSSLKIWVAPTLGPVINATGVILHTNLGRAPL